MSAEEIPWTAGEDEYFAEMQKARAERGDGDGRLGRAVADDSRDGAADYGRRPEDWSDQSASGRRWNVSFQPGSWRHPDAFLTLRRFVNRCPDNTQAWIENNTLYMKVPTS